METIRFSSRAKVITIWILLILAIVFFYRVREVAMPFLWAVLTAYVFHPLVRWLKERTRVPKVIWIILLYLIAGGIIALIVAALIPVLTQQYEDLVRDLPGIIESIQNFIRENSRLDLYGFSINLETISEELVSLLSGLARDLPRQALSGVAFVFGTVFNIIIYLVATFYLLLVGDRWAQTVLSWLPPPAQAELLPLLKRIHTTVTLYLRAQLARIAFVSIVLYIGLSILQVRFALVLALLGGVLDIVPIIGPNISAAVTILVTLSQQPPFGWSHVVLAIVIVVLYIAMNQLEENIILPPLIGYLVGLPPLIVLFAVLAGEHIGGILGLLLAVPIAATIKMVLRYLYAKLMDKPVIYEEVTIRRRPRRQSRKKEKQE